MLNRLFGFSPEFSGLFNQLRPALVRAFWITMLITGISLASVVYMMQVYDRVVSTRSMETLLSLTVAVMAAYLLSEFLEYVRKRLLVKETLILETGLSERVFRAIHKGTLLKVPGVHSEYIKDINAVRQFLSSPAMVTLFELPSALLFLVLVFLINPQLGYFSLLGLVIQIVIAVINAYEVNPRIRKSQNSAFETMYYAYEIMRNAQIMKALGMSHNLENLWLKKQKKMMAEQAIASDIGGVVVSTSKFITLTQSSALLGLGCLLTIYGHMSGGGAMMIVASIIGGKAVQPIAQLLSSWRMVSETRLAYGRLVKLLSVIPKQEDAMSLPVPEGEILVENLLMSAPGQNLPILRGINFRIPKGKVLVVLGASAAGKSTLTRALMGVWPAASGKVRLDGVDIYQWNKDELGQYIGYLPQDVDLFDGTIAENIARFGDVDLSHIQEICQLIGIHDVIDSLPNKYETNIGDEGVNLSGGQKQRIGLARALYKHPKYIVMDEPNSNLDRSGELALAEAIRYMKNLGSTQVIVTHRTRLVREADLILVMHLGTVKMYGPREEVLAAIEKSNAEQLSRK